MLLPINVIESTSAPVLVQLSKAHSCCTKKLLMKAFKAIFKKLSRQLLKTHDGIMVLKQQQSELERHVSDQHFAITEFKFHCVAVFYFIFYLITGALERSTFSSGDWDSKEGFLLLGTNYDTAWFYELSLQHPPTLWARSEGSSVSIGDLHCTLKKGQIHTTTEKENHVFHRVLLVFFFFPLLTSGMQFVYNTSVNLKKQKKASIYTYRGGGATKT